MAYILVVDDDQDQAEAHSIMIKAEGHETRIENNTEKALASMEERKPDLVVLDVMFPESSSAGFDLARKMKDLQQRIGVIPILMVSAINTEFSLNFSNKDIDDDWMPVSDFIEKPIAPDVMKKKIAGLLEKENR